MEQDFYFEESNPRKTKRIIFILILVFLLIVGGLYYYRSKYTLNIKKNLKYEVGTVLPTDVREFVNNKVIDETDYTLLMTSISTEDGVLNKVGDYTYKIKYKNVTKTGKIKVVDTVAPRVEVEELTVGVDEDFLVDDFVKVCEDYSKPCKVEYDDESDSKANEKEGDYNFKIKVSDSAGNMVKKDVTLHVKKGYNSVDTKTSDLKIDHIDPEFADWNNDMIVKFTKACDPNEVDESDGYGELMDISGDDLHNYIDPLYMNNGIEDKQIIMVYNKYNLVIGYAIRVKLDNGLYLYCKK